MRINRWMLGAVLLTLMLGPAEWASAQETTKAAKGAKAAALPPGVAVQRDLVYATVGDKALKLDLYLPEKSGGAQRGLVVWIHGGGWNKGAKTNCPLRWLAAEGYAVASIEYRLTTEAAHPAQIHDCKGAIRWLRANAARLGFDAKAVCVSGGSAGGHLAALVGASGGVKELEGEVGGNVDRSSTVQCTMDLYGPTDLYYNATAEQQRVDVEGGNLWMLLGGKPSTRLDLAKQASPVHWIDAADGPFLILHGTDDPQVKVLQSERLHRACQSAGVTSQLVIIEGAGHGGKAFDDETRRGIMRDFLARHMTAKP